MCLTDMKARTGAPAGGVKDRNVCGQADAERLFRRYAPMVTRRCRMLLGDDDEAADAAQEIFVKVIGDPELLAAEFPSSLLWRMATNRCLNILRDKKAQGRNASGESLLEQIACLDCDNNIEERLESGSILDKLFNRHPKSSRTIAVFHFIDGMTLEETAAEVGMSVSGVRRRLEMLRADLKTNMQ